jgi:hypothetical protein
MYTATLTKESVTRQDGIYNIAVRCVINDGVVDVLDFIATGKYNPASGNTNAPKKEIQDHIKATWDKWKAEQGVYNAAALDAFMDDLGTQTNTYINS